MLLVINHAPDEGSVMETVAETASPTSCAVRPIQQTSVITVTTTIHQVSSTTRTIVMPTSTVASYVTLSTTLAPQSSCSFSDQQQTSTSSSSDCDAVTICIPIVVVFGVIILSLTLIIGILIWKKTKSRSIALPYDKVVPTTMTVDNDLYGLVN